MSITRFVSTTRTAIVTCVNSSINQRKPQYLCRLIAAGILMTISFATVIAQSSPPANTTATAGWTPLALEPGAPAGSYPLGDFDNINLFNGHLNFALPLMRIGGRGRAGYTMMLPIEQNWSVQTVAVPTCDQSGCTYYESNYRYIANPVWWTGILPGYGPGVLQGRQAGSDETTVIGCAGSFFTRTLTRLTFTAPDGTEIELRDVQTGGQPLAGGGCFGGPSRGKIFASADGSAATFVSDAEILDERQPHFPNVIYPSGYLMMRDGTRYRIDSGKTSWIRDANGNQVSFTYSGNDVVGIDDSLNRHISVSATGISFRGANGLTRTVTIHGDSLGNVLRTHPDGSTEFTLKTFSQLFPNLQNPQQGTFNPWVVKDVELPDGRKYEFRYDSYSNLAQVIVPTGGRIEYDWTMGTYQHGDHVFGVYKRVVERRTALDRTTSIFETRTTYSVPAMISGGPTEVIVDNVDPKNGNALLARTKHSFYGEWLPAL